MQTRKVKLDEIIDGSVILYNGPNKALYFGRHTVMFVRRGFYVFATGTDGKNERLYLSTIAEPDGSLPGFYWP